MHFLIKSTMKRFLPALCIFIFLFAVVPFTVFSQEGTDTEPSQMYDFNLAGYGAQGQKTWEIQGASMDMQGSDIKISDITAHLFSDKENMVLTADNGRFDRDNSTMYLRNNVKAVTDNGAELKTNSLEWAQKKQLITTDDRVYISKERMNAVGTGIEAQPDFKVAKLKKDVTVTMDEGTKDKEENKDGKEGLSRNKIIITCDGPMEMDYNSQFAVFHNNVKVDGGPDQGTMHADKMTVYFSADSKQVDKIIAEGNVKIVKGENISLSDTAVLTGADKKVVLTGRPKLVIFTDEGFDVSP